jgi:phosphoglycolate phosphatase-like HAD superfamily hydrolase
MNLAKVKAAFFDVDGVLLDSLPEHLQMCRDKAAEFGLKLKVPDIEQFRDDVSRGEEVSPMQAFFEYVGFPTPLAQRADKDYEHEFAARYHPHAFEGVETMLRDLRSNGLELGLVTSNRRANVVPPLAGAMQYFNQSCVFFVDSSPAATSKAWCLGQGARVLGAAPHECVYIGDQPADATAAESSGMRFLGVTFGWGIRPGNPRIECVDAIAEIPGKLLGARNAGQ